MEKLTRTLKSYMPSRGWAIFLGSVGSITGLMIYDKGQVSAIQRQAKEMASEFSNKPAEWNYANRKVLVFVEPTSWSPYWFKEFVKPIFDAGAVDYYLAEPDDHPAEIVQKVRTMIWDAKQENERKRLYLKRKAAQKAVSSSWSSFFYAPSSSAEEIEVDHRGLEEELTAKYLPHIFNPVYNPDIGIVAIGPTPWRHVLLGLQEGSLTSREKDAKSDSRQARDTHNQLDPTIQYPILGFISAQDLSGWLNVPQRIAGWFSKRYMCQKIADDTLMIIRNESVPFEVNKHLFLGSEGFRPFEKKGEKEKTDIDRVNEKWTEEAEAQCTVDPAVASRLNVYGKNLFAK